MNLHSYLKDIRWFQFSPDIAKAFGPTGSILLCWVIWKSREVEGPVEATVEQISEATGLSEKMIETAKDRLDGILKVTTKRLQHRTWYSVDADALEEAWQKAANSGGNGETPKGPFVMAERAFPESTKGPFVLLTQEPIQEPRKNNPPTPKGVVAGEPVPGVTLNRGKRNPNVPSPESKVVIEAFGTAYREVFGVRYMADAKRDIPAANAFLSAGVTPLEVAATFKVAAKLTSKDCWEATKARDLPGLLQHWRTILPAVSKVVGGAARQKGESITGEDGRNPMD